MYGEMVALTKLDTDMKGYFSTIKKENLEETEMKRLMTFLKRRRYLPSSIKSPADITVVVRRLAEGIQSSFKNYYADKYKKWLKLALSHQIHPDEGSRQFSA